MADQRPIRLILNTNGTWALKSIADVPDYMMTVANRDFQGLFRVVTSKRFVAQSCDFMLTYAYVVTEHLSIFSSTSESPRSTMSPSPSPSPSSSPLSSSSTSTSTLEVPIKDINTTVAALLTPADIGPFGLPVGSAVISCTFRDENTQQTRPKDMTQVLTRLFQMCIIAPKVVLKHIERLVSDVRPSGICIFTAVHDTTRHFHYNTNQLIDKLDYLNDCLILTTDAESHSFTYGKDVYTVYYRTNKLLAVKDKDWYSRTRHAVEQWLPNAEHMDYAIKGCWGMSKKNLKTGKPNTLTDWDLWNLRNIRPMFLYILPKPKK